MPTEEMYFKNATGDEQFMKEKKEYEKSQMLGQVVTGITSLLSQQQTSTSQNQREARRNTRRPTSGYRGSNPAALRNFIGRKPSIEVMGSPLIKQQFFAAMAIRKGKHRLVTTMPPKETKRFVQQAQVESAAFKPIMSAVGPAKTDARKAKESNNTLMYVIAGLSSVILIGGGILIARGMGKGKKEEEGSSNKHSFFKDPFDAREDMSLGMRDHLHGDHSHSGASMKGRRDDSYGKFGMRGIEHPDQHIDR